nr:hypothetical protein [Succinivibrionaceae bacterium]
MEDLNQEYQDVTLSASTLGLKSNQMKLESNSDPEGDKGADGNLEISAEGNLSLHGKVVTISGNQGVTIKSGRNSVSLTPDSVNIVSEFIPSASTGTISTVATLHPSMGFVVTAPNVSISGKHGASLVDWSNSGFKVSRGGTAVTGITVGIKAQGRADIIQETVRACIDQGRELVTFAESCATSVDANGNPTTDDEVDKDGNHVNTTSENLAKFTEEQHNLVKVGYNSLNKVWRLLNTYIPRFIKHGFSFKVFNEDRNMFLVLVSVLDIIATLIDIGAMLFKYLSPKWFNTRIIKSRHLTWGGGVYLCVNLVKNVEDMIALIVGAVLCGNSYAGLNFNGKGKILASGLKMTEELKQKETSITATAGMDGPEEKKEGEGDATEKKGNDGTGTEKKGNDGTGT